MDIRQRVSTMRAMDESFAIAFALGNLQFQACRFWGKLPLHSECRRSILQHVLQCADQDRQVAPPVVLPPAKSLVLSSVVSPQEICPSQIVDEISLYFIAQSVPMTAFRQAKTASLRGKVLINLRMPYWCTGIT